MPGIENILLTFVCGAICDGLFQRKFCKLTRWACPVTPWCWPGPGSAPPGAGAAEAASSPPRSWCHTWWGHNNQMILEKTLGSIAGEICTLLWSQIFISADVIRVSRSPIKVSAAWQQITSVTNLTPSSSHVTRRASEVWLWHHCDITDNLPMRSVPPRPPCLSLSSLSLRYSDCTPPSTLTDCSFPRLLTLSKHDTSVDNLTGTRGLAGGDHCHWPISGDYRGLYILYMFF